MAYKINKNRKGHYALLRTNAPAPAVQEIERLMRLHDDVMRVLTVKVDEHKKAPRSRCRSATSAATVPSVATVPTVVIVAIVRTVATARTVATWATAPTARTPRPSLIQSFRKGRKGPWQPNRFSAVARCALLGRQRTRNRLQGHPSPAALHLRARQDRPSRITAVSANKQRELARAIKRARFLALLPYAVK